MRSTVNVDPVQCPSQEPKVEQLLMRMIPWCCNRGLDYRIINSSSENSPDPNEY